jgi:outer membrane protein
MKISAHGLLPALGLLGIVWLAPPADAQAQTPPGQQETSPLPGGTPPVSGTPPLPAKPPLPPVPGTQPAAPAMPAQAPSLILTAPTGPVAPGPGTGAVPGLTPTTLQQPPREFLPAPDGVRPFARPTETQQVLTMEDAVKIALDNQPLILARIGDYQAQLQNIAIALAPQLPQLSGQWNGFWNQIPSSVQSPAGQSGVPLSSIRSVTTQTRSVTSTATVTAQQLLWDFGKTLAATDAARAGAKSSAENVEIQKQETVRLVKEGYYGLALSNRLVQVSQQALDRALVNLRSAKGFFEVGTQPKSSVTRAEVDVATGQLSLITAVNNVNIFRLTLNQLMGIPINTPTEILDNLAYEHVEFETKNLLNEAFARRPEYRQSKAQYEQADYTVKQQFRNFFPNVVAQGTYGAARSDMNETYSYGLQLNWTIFDGGGKIALYKQAQAQRDAAQARVRDTELTIWQQVERAYVTVQQAEEAIGAAAKGVESADENFRLSQGRFDAGVANIIELTDAQLALTNAQATVAQALAAYRIAIAQLERFMGRR